MAALAFARALAAVNMASLASGSGSGSKASGTASSSVAVSTSGPVSSFDGGAIGSQRALVLWSRVTAGC